MDFLTAPVVFHDCRFIFDKGIVTRGALNMITKDFGKICSFGISAISARSLPFHACFHAAVSPCRVASSTAHVGAIRLSCSTAIRTTTVILAPVYSPDSSHGGDKKEETRNGKGTTGRTSELYLWSCAGWSVICMHTMHPPPILVQEKLPWLCCKLTFFLGKLRPSSIKVAHYGS